MRNQDFPSKNPKTMSVFNGNMNIINSGVNGKKSDKAAREPATAFEPKSILRKLHENTVSGFEESTNRIKLLNIQQTKNQLLRRKKKSKR